MTSLKDFQIISKLGEGAYSSVYKVKRLSDSQEYALKKVKLMDLSDKEKQNALNEVRILASIKHPNIIAYKEAFLEESSNSLCIIMEYANNGDLYQKICEHEKKGTNFPEPELWNIFIQMIKALKALHDMKIFHRDLKSANVFLNKDGTVKLGDLNVSKVAKKGLLYTQTGTPYYASPEVWRDMPYDLKSDVWSLGCVLYEITTLKPPFRAEDMEGLYKKVLRGYYPKVPTHYSQDLSNVIRALLQVSPHLRPSCDKVLQLPAIVKRIEEKHLTELEEEQPQSLLNTIRVPKNLHFLTERLPKANYSQLRTRKVDKTKFLQTLAGYKDTASNPSIIEESMIRGSESVDSYKKEKDNGRVYLPPVGKDVQKDIAKIYGGGRDREKKEIARIKRNNDSRNGLIDDGESDVKKVVKDVEKKAPNRIAYKVHNLDQDAVFDKNPVDVKNIYKPNPKLAGDNASGKDPIHAIIRRHKNQMMRRSPSPDLDDYEDQKKQAKLPPLAQDKYGKLPPLNGEKSYENGASPKKNKKLKELTKVYKINIGNMDDISEKYSIASKAPRKDKHNLSKDYGIHAVNPSEYGANGKYAKGYGEY